jgi:hypothetical protein
MTQLRDDAQRVLKDTFPNGKFFTVSAKPWWKFWAKEEAPLPPAKPPDEKPWWKLW